MKKMLVLILILVSITLFSTATVSAAGETWTVTSVNSIGCASGGINMTTLVSGIASFPTTLRFRTIVDAGGLRYMDEDAGTPGSNGTYGWSIYTSSSGGPTTGTFPIPAGTPIVIQLWLIDGVGGPLLTGTQVTIDNCDGGSVTSIVPLPLTTAACPYPLPSGSAVYQLPAGAPAFFAADLSTQTGFDIPAGTWYVSEFSGDFAKLWIACQASPVWVPSNAVAH